MKSKTVLGILTLLALQVSAADLTGKKVLKLKNTEHIVRSGAGGLTLYVFDPDLNQPGKSVCNAACAEKWPPVLITDQELAQLPAGFSSITRDSGLRQLAVGNRPVYLYFEDRSPAEARGDGLGGVWHALSADLE